MIGNRIIILAIFILLPIFRVSAQVVNLDSGLVAYWSFDEGTGNILHDESGNGNDGVINGAQWVQGISNHALDFNGINGHVNIGDRSMLSMELSFSISAWVYPTGLGSGYYGSGIIANKENEYEIARFGNDTCAFALRNTYPGWSWIETDVLLQLGTWQHVVYTYSSIDSVVELFKNGGESSFTLLAFGPIIDETSQYKEFWIGGRQQPEYPQYFNGLIDEIRVYNKPLNDNAVEFLYKHPDGTGIGLWITQVQQMLHPSQSIFVLYEYFHSEYYNGVVSLQISDDSGMTWNVPATHAWGDIGPNISPGTGKTIYWNAGLDYTNQFNQNMRIKIIADDGQ